MSGEVPEDSPEFSPGGLGPAEPVLGSFPGRVVTEEQRKRLQKSVAEFKEALAADWPEWAARYLEGVSQALRSETEHPDPGPFRGFTPKQEIRDEAVRLYGTRESNRLRREESNRRCVCGHPKGGHRDGTASGKGCWNCKGCKGFEERTEA